MENFYDLLGVSEIASFAEIRAAYKRKVQTAHPDKGGSNEEFQAINEAYRTLSNTELREEYDDYLQFKESPKYEDRYQPEPEFKYQPEPKYEYKSNIDDSEISIWSFIIRLIIFVFIMYKIFG